MKLKLAEAALAGLALSCAAMQAFAQTQVLCTQLNGSVQWQYNISTEPPARLASNIVCTAL
ncbi:MAG: hypothetical protein ACLP7P_06830 [Rhodomicrobium sp.]